MWSSPDFRIVLSASLNKIFPSFLTFAKDMLPQTKPQTCVEGGGGGGGGEGRLFTHPYPLKVQTCPSRNHYYYF